MNFTREPIIETIITPREGCRLIIRGSKQGPEEEFSVDAVEIVSFGPAHFYRSLEKPRPFLVPVSDYEVVEAKESRVVLKNAQFERTIKIGGGRDGSLRKEAVEDEDQVLPVALEDEIAEESAAEPGNDKKRDRRRNRRRRSNEEREEMKHRIEETHSTPKKEVKPEPKKETPKEEKPLPSFTHLIPPPTTLISQTIQKYKDQQSQEPPRPEAPRQEVPEKEEKEEGEATPMSRHLTAEPQPFTTDFTHLNDWTNFLS